MTHRDNENPKLTYEQRLRELERRMDKQEGLKKVLHQLYKELNAKITDFLLDKLKE